MYKNDLTRSRTLIGAVFFYFNRLDFDTVILKWSNSTGLNIKNRNVPATFPTSCNDLGYSVYKHPPFPYYTVDMTGFRESKCQISVKRIFL